MEGAAPRLGRALRSRGHGDARPARHTERRSALPAAINRYSVRNRFLLRLKNQTAGQAAHFAVAGLARDLQVVGYVLAREWSSIPGLVDVMRLLPRTLAKRRAIMARRDRRRSLDAWFV